MHLDLKFVQFNKKNSLILLIYNVLHNFMLY